MASARDTVKECCVCSDIYVNPKLLPCHHSLCESCVRKLRKNNNKVTCPTCRKDCHVDQIVADFRLEEFLEAFREQEEDFVRNYRRRPSMDNNNGNRCELCDKHGVSHWCKNCEQWLCLDCKLIHFKSKVSRDHIFEALEDKNKLVVTDLQAEMKRLREKIEEYGERVYYFDREINKTQNAQNSALKKLGEMRESTIKTVKSHFDNVEIEILANSERLVQRLNKLREEVVHKVNDLEEHMCKINYELNSNSAKIAYAGETLLREAKDILSASKIKNFEIDPLEFKLHKDSSVGLDKIVKMTATGGKVSEIQAKHDKAQETRTSPPKQLQKVWRKKKGLKLTSWPCALCPVEDKLWQCQQNGVHVFDEDLKLQKSISSVDTGYIRVVVSWRSGEVVAAAKNGLYHLTHNGKKISQIATGHYACVATNAGKIYAAPWGHGEVEVWDQLENKWQKRQRFNVPKDWITLYVNNQYIYVCLYEANMVNIYSHKGKLVHSVGKKGGGSAGRLDNPHSYYGDKHGSLLIADFGNNRLQRLCSIEQWKNNDQWHVLQLEPAVKGPCAATFFRDKLFVTSGIENSLSIYE